MRDLTCIKIRPIRLPMGTATNFHGKFDMYQYCRASEVQNEA